MVEKNKFEQGDIILINFNPQAGHEQSGTRPAIVISNFFLNNKTNMSMVAPITSKIKQHPFHIILDNQTKTQGMILCEHSKCLDLNARNTKFLEKAPNNILEDVIHIISGYIEKL